MNLLLVNYVLHDDKDPRVHFNFRVVFKELNQDTLVILELLQNTGAVSIENLNGNRFGILRK